MADSSFEGVELVVRTIAQTAVDNEKYFGELDAVVGDGDFGYSMARGFELVLADFDDFDRADIGTFLKKIAVVITSRVGGTSGPLWGTGFLGRVAVAAGKTELTSAGRRSRCSARPIEGIKKRGNSDLGDKTLLDALEPAVDELETALAGGDDAGTAIRKAAAIGARAGRGDQGDDRQARPGRVHGRAQHRDAGRGGGRRRAHVRAGRRRMGGRRVAKGRETDEEVRQRPEGVRPRDAQGDRARQPGHAQVRARVQPDHADRRPQRREGLDRAGLGIRARARARDDRGQGDARRRLPGRRVRGAADGLRARDHQAAQLRDGRTPPDQQLHR